MILCTLKVSVYERNDPVYEEEEVILHMRMKMWPEKLMCTKECSCMWEGEMILSTRKDFTHSTGGMILYIRKER
jgi:hypothetical protein